KKSRWLSIFYTAIPVGSALGYLTGGAVEHATHDWRQAFFVAGVPGLALGALCLLVQEPAGAPSGEPHPYRAPARKSAVRLVGAARDLLALPLYRTVVLGQCAYTFAIGGFAYWAPKYIAARYATEPHPMDAGRAAFVFGLVTVVGGAVGTLVGGRLGDRAAKGRSDDDGVARGNLSVCAIATGLAAPLAAICIAMPSSNGFFAVVLPCEIALFIPGGPFNVAILRSVPPHLRASAMAMSIFASHLLGDLWSPPLIGLVADHAPMAWAMLMCPAAYALAALCWWRGRRGRRGRGHSPRPRLT
ncbi:MAG: MFS transporter, partial [Polyangiaceae bacterium]